MSNDPTAQGREPGAAMPRLRDQAFSGARWTSLASVVRIVLQFAQLAILARLLPPADFGNMAVVLAVIAFAQIFADLGVSNAIITRTSITASTLSSLYWLNIFASACVALILLVCAPWVASFYGEPVLQPLLSLAGLHLLVTASWQQLRVLAEKELRFETLARIEIGASIAGLVVAVTMAWAGAGVYALIGGVLAVSATGAGLAWLLLARGWRPQLRLRFGEIRGYLAFGTYMIGNDIANTVS
ncbi:MAG TPA: oligosaccharide flippase family protein, partial [Burkholderiales bacterium]|nr:oligosaccharide flippase family protein [Burkholderiales bacterium]